MTTSINYVIFQVTVNCMFNELKLLYSIIHGVHDVHVECVLLASVNGHVACKILVYVSLHC